VHCRQNNKLCTGNITKNAVYKNDNEFISDGPSEGSIFLSLTSGFHTVVKTQNTYDQEFYPNFILDRQQQMDRFLLVFLKFAKAA
jgi:hypothetical protein